MGPAGHDTYLGHGRFDAAAVARVFRWAGPTSHVVRTTPDGFEMAFDDGYVAALAGLTNRETEALTLLTAERFNAHHRPVALWKRTRRRAMRRYVQKNVPAAEAAQLRARVDRELGSTTKPVDPLSPLCWKLRDRVGLSYQEIVDLLDAAELEKRPVDGGSAKVQRRVDRFGKRLSPEELQKLRAGGVDRTLGAQLEGIAA